MSSEAEVVGLHVTKWQDLVLYDDWNKNIHGVELVDCRRVILRLAVLGF